MRNLVSQVIERSFPKSIEVGIPRGSRPDIKTSSARLLDNFVTRVLDRDRMFFPGFRRFGQNGVERTILLPAFLDPKKRPPLIVCNSRNSQIRQQSKLQNSLSGHERFERDRGDAEEVFVFGNHGLDLVADGGKQTAVFIGAGGVVYVFGSQ